ncbi:MAG: prephenate dehydrogenase [Clostridia bacterium]|nr:prephenate dehydrogenase [Clostridia bacterium]
MIAGIVGLGLIGGSFAKAYKKADDTVLALDTDKSTLSFAMLAGSVDDKLTKENISNCDIVLLCTYPAAAIEFLDDFGKHIGKKAIVIDCCGTKRDICKEGFSAAREYGFTYLGGHPMAGTQFSGFKYSKATLFYNAPMVIVPPSDFDIVLLDKVKQLLSPAKFAHLTVTTAEEHDKMIAFTSELAHIVSSAYIKSPTALSHKGFSAGSYRDLTRVAWMNADMWSELFLDTKDYLIEEIDTIIKNLNMYKETLQKGDQKRLKELINEGKRIKEKVDG